MKIGESLASQRPEVCLPIEIIAQIVSFLPSGSPGQSSSWACCLVSRQWYSAAISKLYERPRLTGPNFDKFAAVVCPPVNARVRRIGLEHYVKRLDMSVVAYESTNSQTARLLRRVGPGLEEFIAPATSFSTSCLPPISKCHHLRRLDLRLTQSHSFSRIDLYALLGRVGKLKSLVHLSLPPSSFTESRLLDPRNATIGWPPNLTELQFNNLIPETVAFWQGIACLWPASLSSLVFRDCKHLGHSFLYFVFPQITSLRVDARESGRVMRVGFQEWFQPFPQLRFLSIPGQGLEYTALAQLEVGGRQTPLIEQLELTRGGEEVTNFSIARLISRVTSSCPSLWQVRLHEAYAEFDDVWADCQDADIVLKNRAIAQNQAAGQTVCDPEVAGVSFF